MAYTPIYPLLKLTTKIQLLMSFHISKMGLVLFLCWLMLLKFIIWMRFFQMLPIWLIF